MTYCVAMSLDAGMLFASDSRTNAGVDQIARFSKMRVFGQDGERVIVTLSSGNLSITQNVLSTLEQRVRGGDGALNLTNAPSMFDVARLALCSVALLGATYWILDEIDANAWMGAALLAGAAMEPTACRRLDAGGDIGLAALGVPDAVAALFVCLKAINHLPDVAP